MGFLNKFRKDRIKEFQKTKQIRTLDETLEMADEWFANVWHCHNLINENPLKAVKDIDALLEDLALKADVTLTKREIVFISLMTLRYVATQIIYVEHGITLEKWLKSKKVGFSGTEQ